MVFHSDQWLQTKSNVKRHFAQFLSLSSKSKAVKCYMLNFLVRGLMDRGTWSFLCPLIFVLAMGEWESVFSLPCSVTLNTGQGHSNWYKLKSSVVPIILLSLKEIGPYVSECRLMLKV